MLDNNNVVAFDDGQITNNLPLISVDDVRQQIDFLDKAEGSRKNIKAGFNRMLQLGLIKESQLQEQFSSSGFPPLLLNVKQYILQNKCNKQWPSFLNDIRQAVSSFTFSISDESSFSETIRFFAYRKLGSHLSDEKISNEIVNSKTFPEDLPKRDTKRSYTRWLRGGELYNIGEVQKRLLFIDDFLGANGVIIKKGHFLMSLNTHRGQGGKKNSVYLDLPPRVLQEAELFLSWKISGARPSDSKQFKKLNTNTKRQKRAVNSSPWTINSDGECSTRKNFMSYFKAAFTYSDSILKRDEFSFSSIFDVDFLDGFVRFLLERDAPGFAIKVLDWMGSESKEKTYTSQYLIPESFSSYDEWLDELNYVHSVIVETCKSIRSNHEALDGKRNVKCILESDNPWGVYDELSRIMRKIVISKDHSLWCHASYLAFRWMIYCPLRIRNVSMLKWLGRVESRKISVFDNDKEIGVYQNVDTGCFGIFVHRSHLKNKGAKGVDSINQEFNGMNSYFEKYLTVRERELNRLGVESEYWVFGVSKSGKKGLGGRVTPNHVANELVKITQQALNVLYPEENHSGINPHAMRHLSATLYLNDNPENYTGLATLLMDKIETVIAVYAKVNTKQNAKKISEWAHKRMTNAT